MAYVSDYQGSNRCVVDRDGMVLSRQAYYPYGLPFASSVLSDRYQFGGKEFETASGLYLHDFEARWLASDLPRFTTPDPLSSSTPDISHYTYCNANPIRFTDPSGMRIRFAEGSNLEFMRDFFVAYAYLYSIGESYNLDRLAQSDKVYTINQIDIEEAQRSAGPEGSDLSDRFRLNSLTIDWDPKSALLTDQASYVLTPAELLNHEAAHAAMYDINAHIMRILGKIYAGDYGNMEELRVICGSELDVARKTGRLDSEFVRDNHLGLSKTVDSPISVNVKELISYGTKK